MIKNKSLYILFRIYVILFFDIVEATLRGYSLRVSYFVLCISNFALCASNVRF